MITQLKHNILAVAGALCLFLAAAPVSAAESPDLWDQYDALLQRHVHQGSRHGIKLNLVDYDALSRDPLFKALLKRLASYPKDRLVTRKEKLAFYINAYNLLAMKMVADHWPVDSIKDAGSLFRSVWNKPAGIIMGKSMTLDEIENGILRPMREPGIHFAIVCASISCPDLRKAAYRANRLERQLDDQTRLFLDNPGKGLALRHGALYLSRIFDWFEDDFAARDGVTAFIRRHHPALPAGQPDIEYFDYDWSVNATRRP